MNSTMREAVPLFIPTNMQYSNGVLTQIQEENSQGFKICEEGLEVIKEIGDNEVIVISIYGEARSGKSYQMTQLGGVRFIVSHFRQTETAGIWIGTFKLPNTNSTVILLDCEGTDSIITRFNTAGFNSEQKILTLCYMLSSVIIYNCNGITIKHSLNKLQHVIEYINRTSSNDLNDFSTHSRPILWWLFRNSTLLYDDEDLWDSFKNEVFRNESLQVETQHLIDSIERGFCTVKTTMLRPPSTDPNVCANLDSPQNQDELKIFKKGISDFRDELFSYAEIKSMGGLPLTGKRLAEFVNGTLKSLLGQLEFPRFDKLWDMHVNDIKREAETASKRLFANTLETIKLPLTQGVLEKKFELTKELAEMVFYRKAQSAMEDSNWDAKCHFESFFERDMKSRHCDQAQTNVCRSIILCNMIREAKFKDFSEMEFPQDLLSGEGLQIVRTKREILLSTYAEETAGYKGVDYIKTNLSNEIDKRLFEVLITTTKQNVLNLCNRFFVFYIVNGGNDLQKREVELRKAFEDLLANLDNDALNDALNALFEELNAIVQNRDEEVQLRVMVLCAIVFSIISLFVLYNLGLISYICEVGKTNTSKIVEWFQNVLIKMITEVISRVLTFVTNQVVILIERFLRKFINPMTTVANISNESLQLLAVRLIFQAQPTRA